MHLWYGTWPITSGRPKIIEADRVRGKKGCFPDSYEEMQPIPVLKTGILSYAGDDGPEMGQTYHMRYDLDQKTLTVALPPGRAIVMYVLAQAGSLGSAPPCSGRMRSTLPEPFPSGATSSRLRAWAA